MLSVVYFCKGQVRGYVNNGITLTPELDPFDVKLLLRNFVREGVKQPDNVVPEDEKNYTAVVFDAAGKAIYTYSPEHGDGRVVPYDG
jgi:hypothetical protein